MLGVRATSDLVIDARSRLTIPAAVRRALSHSDVRQLVLAADRQRVIAMQGVDYSRLIERSGIDNPFEPGALPLMPPVTGAADVPIDGHGRVLIPRHLRESADLLRDVRFVSTTNRIEIWNPDRWEAAVATANAQRSNEGASLCLYFRRTLRPMNEALVRSLIVNILGDSGDYCRSEYTPTTNGAVIRLSGLSLDDLVRIAEGLAEFFDRAPRAEVVALVEGAVAPAIDRAVRSSLDVLLPDVVSSAVAPMAVLQAQLGERIIAHVEKLYTIVERTELALSNEVATALRGLETEVIESKLDRSQWAWDAAAGKLIRQGGWAMGTGAAGSGLVEFLLWVATVM